MIKPWMYVSPKGWQYWDELDEADCATDNIFCCMFSNINAGGDETGQGGGLSGADLDLTEAGTVAGATGTPPTRVMDGINDEFLTTAGLIQALIANANKTWSIILKTTNLESGGDNPDGLFCFAGTGDETVDCAKWNNDTIGFRNYEDNVGETETTVGTISAATVTYFAMWADGTILRAGFTETRPTKWSDFAANDRVQWTTLTGDYSGELFNLGKSIASLNGGSFVSADLYYVVVAKISLIDNDT